MARRVGIDKEKASQRKAGWSEANRDRFGDASVDELLALANFYGGRRANCA